MGPGYVDPGRPAQSPWHVTRTAAPRTELGCSEGPIRGRDAGGHSEAGEARGTMRRPQGAMRWALVGLGALLLLVGAFGIIRSAALWHLVGSLAR
jgi:hypothetical protein